MKREGSRGEGPGRGEWGVGGGGSPRLVDSWPRSKNNGSSL